MWDDLYDLETNDDQEAHRERVLVAVVPCLDDWRHISQDHWYRIPVVRAPKRLAADYVAFYHPKCFEEWRWTIRFYATINQYRIVKRCDLLPDEPQHPRADELYYKLELGDLEELARPIPSPNLRRITFIMTTLETLFTAQDVHELWLRSAARDRLWQVLKTREIAARRDYAIHDEQVAYYPDLAVFCAHRSLAIQCVSRDHDPVGMERAGGLLADRGWALECFAAKEVIQEPGPFAEWVSRFVAANGGLKQATQ